MPIYAKEAVERAIEIATEASAKVYNSRGSYSKHNVSAPNLNYVWEQRKRNGRYSFHINRKHKLLEDIRKQLDEDGKLSLSAYLSLIENFAPFMQSGMIDTMNTDTSPTDSLENDVEIENLKTHIALFKKSGFTVDEIRDTLLEMSSYRHLKDKIKELLED